MGSMYLRRHRRKVGEDSYDYWTLCESVRTGRGPRQRVVAHLGKLTEGEAREHGWEQIDALLEGRRPAQQLEFGQGAGDPGQWEKVNLRGLEVERVRDFGQIYLALALWRRLGLHTLLQELIEPGREEVGWETMACVLTVARFCAQKSELGVAERWYEGTALEDLLGLDGAKINDDRLYRCLDVLGAQKQALCAHLMERYRSWFGVRFEFLLYDVTSTFFEGQALGNEKAARGHSRDSRPDCAQVCIGLVVTPEGLPLAYEVFSGNRPDVTTVEEMVEVMEEKYGQAERVWVMDRGMVSEENLDFLRERGARYLVGTPKSQLRNFEADLLDRQGWHQVQSGVEAKLLAHPDGQGEEQFILCRSAARQQKEAAMFARQMDRLSEQLERLDRSLQKRARANVAAVERRIGRWQGRYPAAARLLEANVCTDEAGRACGLTLWCPVASTQWAALTQGAYLLRTNCTEKDPALLWRWYIQLTQAESAFRTAKSDLGLRPVYHQKTERVEAHILVCFLGLALWRTLEMWMLGKGLGSCARQLVEELSKIKSMDVTVPVRRDNNDLTLRLRVVGKPHPAAAQLLAHLGLELPTRSKILENVVQKTGLS